MKQVILATGLLLIYSLSSYSQTTQTRTQTSSQNDATIEANSPNKTVHLASGTRLNGELQNTIDVRRAKVGDEVVLKTTQAIKSEGRTVVKKGARLIGRVTEVSQKSEANGESRVGILFDRLESGSLELAIAATITSITKSQASASRHNQSVAGIDAGESSSTSARSTASGQRTSSAGSVVGSVVGGVTNSVGGVVNTTSSATGDLVGSTATTVDSTVNSSTSAAVGSLGRIQISESADASASGSSVLSLRGENLRVEKGTSFSLVLTQTASGGTRP